MAANPTVVAHPIESLIGRLGHELRTPVVAALVHLGILERQLTSLDGSEEALSSVGHVRQALNLLDRLIDRALEIHRRGTVRLRRERIQLQPLVNDALQRLTTMNPAARSQVECIVAPTAEAFLDRTALEEILDNLLSNAVKFGEGRSIRLMVEQAGEGARLTIRDHGMGIATDDQARIFDAFVRGSSSASFPGLGLGLWIVRQLVEAHGGKIAVESTPGHGTAVDVLLPA
jgi:signal transduction histidine kinase